MINLFDKEVLYDKKVTKEYAVKLLNRKETDKISILSDSMFKAVFQNENRIKYPCRFVSYFLDKEYDYLLHNLKFVKNEIDKKSEKDKGERCDFIASVDGININIEINNNSNIETMERNIEYASRIYSGKVKVGSKYIYIPCLQLNINNFAFEDNDKTIDTFYLMNEDGTILTNKVIFVLIYVPNIRKKWYTSGIESLTEFERYLLTLTEQNIEESLQLGKGDKFMEQFVNDAIDISAYYSSLGESYNKEEALREELYNDGLIEGKKERNIEIAKKMLDKNADINFISEITNLSIKEIEMLQN